MALDIPVLAGIQASPAMNTYLQALHRLPTEYSLSQQNAMRKQLLEQSSRRSTLLGGAHGLHQGTGGGGGQGAMILGGGGGGAPNG